MFIINYEKYSKQAIKKLNIIQDNFRKKYKIDSYDNWFYNQSSELLRLYNDKDEKEIFYTNINKVNFFIIFINPKPTKTYKLLP